MKQLEHGSQASSSLPALFSNKPTNSDSLRVCVCSPAVGGQGPLRGHAVVGGGGQPGIWPKLLVVGQDVPLLAPVASLAHLQENQTFQGQDARSLEGRLAPATKRSRSHLLTFFTSLPGSSTCFCCSWNTQRGGGKPARSQGRCLWGRGEDTAPADCRPLTHTHTHTQTC